MCGDVRPQELPRDRGERYRHRPSHNHVRYGKEVLARRALVPMCWQRNLSISHPAALEAAASGFWKVLCRGLVGEPRRSVYRGPPRGERTLTGAGPRLSRTRPSTKTPSAHRLKHATPTSVLLKAKLVKHVPETTAAVNSSTPCVVVVCIFFLVL